MILLLLILAYCAPVKNIREKRKSVCGLICKFGLAASAGVAAAGIYYAAKNKRVQAIIQDEGKKYHKLPIDESELETLSRSGSNSVFDSESRLTQGLEDLTSGIYSESGSVISSELGTEIDTVLSAPSRLQGAASFSDLINNKAKSEVIERHHSSESVNSKML